MNRWLEEERMTKEEEMGPRIRISVMNRSVFSSTVMVYLYLEASMQYYGHSRLGMDDSVSDCFQRLRSQKHRMGAHPMWRDAMKVPESTNHPTPSSTSINPIHDPSAINEQCLSQERGQGRN